MTAVIAKRIIGEVLDEVLHKENRGGIYGIAAALCFFASAVRLYTLPENILGWVLLTISGVVTIVTVFVCLDTDTTPAMCRRMTRFAQMVAASMFVSLFWVVPSSDIWVLPGQQQTSLHHRIFWMPFYPMPQYYPVNLDHSRQVRVDITTTDAIPLTCSIKGHGIRLDDSDAPRLEHFLLGIAQTRDPDAYLDGEVKNALAAAAGSVLSSRSTEEIGRQGQFVIPYKIGTPMGNVLARDMLRWRDGYVTFDCEVSRFQS